MCGWLEGRDVGGGRGVMSSRCAIVCTVSMLRLRLRLQSKMVGVVVVHDCAQGGTHSCAIALTCQQQIQAPVITSHEDHATTQKRVKVERENNNMTRTPSERDWMKR